jgi:plasmid stabilization system protein ParE
MRKNIEILPAARRELDQIAGTYNDEVSGLGGEFLGEVEKSLKILQEHPFSGPEYLAGTRRMRVARFPYAVVYRVNETRLVVVAIAHHRRRPGYWQSGPK